MDIIICAAVLQPYKFVEIRVVHYYRGLYILWTTLQQSYMDTSFCLTCQTVHSSFFT